jgi:rhodanese-related sulfurtransferase
VAVVGLIVTAGAGAGHHGLSPEALAAQISENRAPFILDVRTPDEYAEGHVPGAVNIPFDALPGRLDELPATREEIVVYCRSGRRAVIAEDTLRANGYLNLRELSGHWLEWSKQTSR